MSGLEYIVVIILGLIMGSFLNVCIYRIPQGESIAFPPSHCSSCGHALSVLDLFPVISYMVLKGKCRYCGEKIAVQYPLVELVTAVIFVMVYRQYGISWDGVATAVLVGLLVTASVIDLNCMRIPNKINLIIVAVGCIHMLQFDYKVWIDCFLGLLLGGGSLFLMGLIGSWLLNKEAMGGGDVKLMAACGIFLGLSKTLFALLFAFYAAAVVIIVLLVAKRLKRNQNIAFGPFLCSGVIIAVLFFQPLAHMMS